MKSQRRTADQFTLQATGAITGPASRAMADPQPPLHARCQFLPTAASTKRPDCGHTYFGDVSVGTVARPCRQPA